MLRIGEVAKKYDISNRTLRYWEDAGILKSTRLENGYRYYDEENVTRINQIVLLRRLDMPIAEIEKIFMTNDYKVAVEVLEAYLSDLDRNIQTRENLSSIIEHLIFHINQSQNMDQLFLQLANQTPIQHTALQIRLPERNVVMEKLQNVRIVKLPPMTVASYCAVSVTPEEDCGKVIDPFVLENNLHQKSGFRSFGFNNPDPSEDRPEYGYETWITIPEDMEVPLPLERKKFSGGLYASISTDMNQIGERWEALGNWVAAQDKYDCAFYDLPWLEELSMDYETFISKDVPSNEKQLDILYPIKLKNTD